MWHMIHEWTPVVSLSPGAFYYRESIKVSCILPIPDADIGMEPLISGHNSVG